MGGILYHFAGSSSDAVIKPILRIDHAAGAYEFLANYF
jgi:hypothetical protein